MIPIIFLYVVFIYNILNDIEIINSYFNTAEESIFINLKFILFLIKLNRMLNI